MKSDKSYRINGFEQIKAFYSWVFNNPDKARPTIISLYLFLINQANRANWAEWFKCPYDLAMQGACIGSNSTYYKCLDDLKNWKLIDYEKGLNNYKAPLIRLKCLYNNEQLTEQVNVPLSEQQTEQQIIQLTEQLPEHIYKLLTYNLKRITDNLSDVVDFLNSLEGKPKKDFIGAIISAFKESYANFNQLPYEVTNEGKERAAAGKLLQMYKEKFPDNNSEQTLKSMRVYFDACVSINDDWLRKRMTLPILLSEFNKINNILKHGRNKTGGATDAELTAITTKHFPVTNG
jgi:hypothetical protein